MPTRQDVVHGLARNVWVKLRAPRVTADSALVASPLVGVGCGTAKLPFAIARTVLLLFHTQHFLLVFLPLSLCGFYALARRPNAP